MTGETLREADPLLASALDSFDAPPPLPRSFTDRVVSAAQERSGAPLPVSRRGLRRRLGLWTHGRRAVVGSASLLVLGATAAAAATGLLERVVVDLAPVERIVERVAEAVPGMAPAELARAEPEATSRLARPQAEPSPEAAPLDDPRRERLAQVIAARIERRIARAEARGIVVPDSLRDTDRRMAPERAAAQPERAELVERVQQIRKDRQQAQAGSFAEDASRDDELARIADGWAELSWRERTAAIQPFDRSQRRRLFTMLTPEQRAEILQVRRQRRAGAAEPQEF